MKTDDALSKRYQSKGFTLVEMMIVVVIVGILAAIAAPSFREIQARQRIRSAGSDLVSHLTLTRSEAIKQNGDVTMSSTSANASWTNGWSIAGSGGVVASHEPFTRIIISTGSGGASAIVYTRSGRVSTGASTNFQISDATVGSSVIGRCIIIGTTGQTSSKDGTC